MNSTRRTELVFAIAMPIGAWTPALPIAVASLRAQKVPLRVAVMDASGDPRVQVALRPMESLVCHHREGPDAGQADAIQEGWDALDGDVYGWLNADDFLFPGALARVGKAFLEDPCVGVVTAHSAMVSPEFHLLGAHPSVFPPDETLSRNNMIAQPSTFIRRRDLRAVGGLSRSLHYTMDWDLWARLQEAGTGFRFLDEMVSGAVMDPSAKTAQFNSGRRREIFYHTLRRDGPVTAAKTLAGFFLQHLAVSEVNRSIARVFYERHRYVAKTKFGVAGCMYTSSSLWPFVRFDRDISAIRLISDAACNIWASDRLRRRVEPGRKIEFNWPIEKVCDLRIEPVQGAVTVERVELE